MARKQKEMKQATRISQRKCALVTRCLCTYLAHIAHLADEPHVTVHMGPNSRARQGLHLAIQPQKGQSIGETGLNVDRGATQQSRKTDEQVQV